MVSVQFDQTDTPPDPAGDTAFSLAHISDPHISCMGDIRLGQLLNKRLFGYLKWKLHRRAEHRDSILATLRDDLRRSNPDHIVVTGDLTHLSLPAEFRRSRQWLESLGTPARITVIPGNHDTYVKTVWQQTLAHWTDYMVSDETDNDKMNDSATNFENIFPSMRVRGRVALIGVCTARPTAPHLAVGRIGYGQMQKIETLLAGAAERHLFRVLMIHHPPAHGIASWRKRLTDAADLRALLARSGAELVLHGHTHKNEQAYLKTPTGRTPVIGVPSASALGRTLRRRARYYTYYITPGASGWRLRLEGRVYVPEQNRFIPEHGHPLEGMTQ